MSDRPDASGRTSEPLGRTVVVCAEGPPGFREIPPPAVGTTKFHTATKMYVGVVVKVALTALDEEGRLTEQLRWPPDPPVLSLDREPRFLELDPEALDYASDFVPEKMYSEIQIVGHARSARPTALIQGAVQAPELLLLFAARAAREATEVPLAAPYLKLEGAGERLGPHRDPGRYGHADQAYPDDLHAERMNSAAPSLRMPLGTLPSDATLRLTGLTPDGEPWPVALPGLEPVVTADTSWGTSTPVEMALDTLWLDADTWRLELVWRGKVEVLESEGEIHRLVVSMEKKDAARHDEARLGDCQRGVIVFATTEDDLHEGVMPPTEDVRLELARYGTWGAAAPEPRIPLEDYARMSAEMGEAPDKRAVVLERNGLTEDKWFVEERAWLERFAFDAMGGNSALAERYGELFVAAQDELATPEELERTLRDYAEILVAIEGRADFLEILARVPISLAAWVRLDRRWKTAADEDPAIVDELEDLLVELRAERDAAQPPELEATSSSVDDEGGGGDET